MEHKLPITPISHAAMVLHLGGQVIYTDPVGGADAFKNQPSPNLILVTDIHGDHLNPDTLKAVAKEDTVIVVPQAVQDILPEGISGTIVVMANGEKGTQKGVEIQAIPMYNLPESAEMFHTKGRGNGYVVSADGKRIYIAGDTAAIPEMKMLKNIDVAFIPMNLPYTMSVEEAAEGVLAFKPKVVHPYHYRGPDGLANINKFKELVNAGDPNIQVELLNFYPNN
jgi:L-ascorbate metabolism protein UlaG (beta-lactamase superfamily)